MMAAANENDRICLRVQAISVEPPPAPWTLDASTERAHRRVFNLRTRESFEFAASRGPGFAASRLEVEPDQLVILEMDNGIRIWTSARQAAEDYGHRTSAAAPSARGRRAAAAGGVEFEISAALPVGSPSRGLTQWVLRALHIVDVDPLGAAAGATAAAIANRIESRLVGEPGVHRCRGPAGTAGPVIEPERLDAIPAAGKNPVLVFLHGTASSTHGSFGGLWLPEHRQALEKLFRYYGNRVYALEHRTLSAGPIENAIDLVKTLPDGALVHLVSHSRGGLIGELLCRANVPLGEPCFSAGDLSIFERAAAEASGEPKRALQDQLRQLKALDQLLRRKKLRIERFLRVGCPARGTTLASGRLDRWLSVGLNVLQRITDINPLASVLADVYVELLAAVVKKRLDPSALPGLHAQTPTAPLIALLNRPDSRTTADLTVLAGDLDGRGFLGSVAELATRWFFGAENDLVVDTASMYGGAARSAARRFFDRGPDVTHFNYFVNEQTVRRIVTGLTGTDAERSQSFEPLDEVPRLLPPRAARLSARGVEDGPVVFVLPGIMGSQLAVNGKLVWVDMRELSRGGLSRLAIDATGISATAPDGETYQPLIDALGQYGTTIPFAYDWRLSIQSTAERLAAAVSRELDRVGSKRPVQFVAHSMGGLVVRAMIGRHPEVWKRVTGHEDARFIMLGTPNQGSHAITAMLVGEDFLVNALSLVDLDNSRNAILRIVKRYPGALELMPHWVDNCDFFNAPVWRNEIMSRARMHPDMAPAADDLRNAEQLRELLQESAIDPRRMHYIAGCAPATLEQLEFDAIDALSFTATARGDGRVLWRTGIPSELRPLYVDAVHGDIPKHPEAIRACLDILRHGATQALSADPPRARAAAMPFKADKPVIDVFPDANDIVDAAIGRTRRPGEQKAAARPTAVRVKVRVTQAHLRVAQFPLLVGHYDGDGLVSAEAEVDRQLMGRLRQRYDLGLYPGALGTCGIFAAPASRDDAPPPFPGAVVVGLGKVGHLAPGDLAEGIRRALLELVSAADDGTMRSAIRSDGDGLGVSVLIVGGTEGGVGFRDSLNAIFKAVAEANARIEALADRRLGQIREVQVIELYQDRAHQAYHLLHALTRQADYGRTLDVSGEIEVSDGALRRIEFDSGHRWWRSIQISAEGSRLGFKLLTDLARSEGYSAYIQTPVVRRFVDSATRSTATRPELSTSLFELLLPTELKDAAPRQENLRLLLDEEAAGYPWELLQDPFQRDSMPLVIQSAVLRQIDRGEGTFRQRPRVATADLALVIGDTDTRDMRDVFPELKGAQEEGSVVNGLLNSAGFGGDCRIMAAGDEVLHLLLSGRYRILHLAAHGVFEQEIEPGAGPATGMALGGGLYLSPAEVHQMRIVPQLVFLNCCYLGQMRSDKPKRFHRIAANLAAAFIDNGVRCVVAAGWEVDDAAAKCFAEAFYREMIAGQTFAAAVLEARRRTYFEHPRVNTWGAYQCYGDPDFRLRLSQAVADPTSRDEKFGSVEELCVALETLTAQASAGSADNRDRLLERVALLKRGCNETWLRTHARLSEEFGRAFAVCEDFDSAIESYRDGMRAAQGDATLAMLEQLVNVSARQAARNAIRMKRGSAYDVEAVRKQILDSMDELAAFTRKYPTRERWSLMGSALRRLALVDAVQGDLSDMRAQIAASVAHYERANRLPGGLDPYAAFGAALGQLIGKWQDRTALDDVDRRLADIAAVLDPKGPRRDFWTSVYFADLALLRTLHAFATGRKTLPAELSADAVAAAYEAAMRRGANWQQRRSVQETFDFIALTLQRSGERRRGKPAEQMRAAVQLVQTIAKRLGFAPVQQAQGQASEQPAR